MINIKLDDDEAWVLTEVLSQWLDDDKNLFNDSDLHKDAMEVYEIVLKMRGFP